MHPKRANAVLDRHFLTWRETGRHDSAAGVCSALLPNLLLEQAALVLVVLPPLVPHVAPRAGHPGWYRRLRTISRPPRLQPWWNRRSERRCRRHVPAGQRDVTHGTVRGGGLIVRLTGVRP